MITGRHYQNAYVTRNVDKAVADFKRHADIRLLMETEVQVKAWTPKGEGVGVQKLAFVWVGDQQYELIEPKEGAILSIYRDALPADDSAADAPRHCQHGRSGALDAQAAPRPDHRRRSQRWRSARYAQKLEHRPSRRDSNGARLSTQSRNVPCFSQVGMSPCVCRVGLDLEGGRSPNGRAIPTRRRKIQAAMAGRYAWLAMRASTRALMVFSSSAGSGTG